MRYASFRWLLLLLQFIIAYDYYIHCVLCVLWAYACTRTSLCVSLAVCNLIIWSWGDKNGIRIMCYTFSFFHFFLFFGEQQQLDSVAYFCFGVSIATVLRRGESEGTSRENKIECIMRSEHAPFSVCVWETDWKMIFIECVTDFVLVRMESEYLHSFQLTPMHGVRVWINDEWILLIWILIFARNQFICQAFRCISSHGDKTFHVFLFAFIEFSVEKTMILIPLSMFLNLSLRPLSKCIGSRVCVCTSSPTDWVEIVFNFILKIMRKNACGIVSQTNTNYEDKMHVVNDEHIR